MEIQIMVHVLDDGSYHVAGWSEAELGELEENLEETSGEEEVLGKFLVNVTLPTPPLVEFEAKDLNLVED